MVSEHTANVSLLKWGYGFESHILYKKKYIRVYSRGEKPALEAGSGEFDPLHPNNSGT